MKNKKFFSASLYNEGLRQTRVIGLVYFAVSAFVCLISLITSLTTEPRSSIDLSVSNNLVGYMFGYILVAPLLCLTLFHFLNTRAASDAYHSIPQSRLQLFTSFFAAVQTWLTAPVLVGVLNIMLQDMFIRSIRADYAEIFCYVLVLLSCNVLVSAAVVLAMTLCSTVFSQLAVSALILFMPRALLSLFYDAVSGVEVLVPDSYRAGGLFGKLFANNYNCVFETFSSVFVGSAKGDTAVSIIYTFALGIIFAVIAAVLFIKRKSEIAATSAPNSVVQAAVRILVAFAFCLPCCMSFINGEAEFSSVALLLFLALAAYFAYELITKRTLRGSWKSMLIGLAVLVGINAVFVLGAFGAGAIIRNIDTSPENIASVSLINYTERSIEEGDYIRYLASRYEITDEKTIEFVSDWIEETKAINSVYESEVLDIKLKSGVTVRRRLSGGLRNRENDFADLLCENEEFRDAVLRLPEKSKIYSCELQESALGEKECMELFESFRGEFEKLSKDERDYLMRNSLDYTSLVSIGKVVEPVIVLDIFVARVKDDMSYTDFFIRLTSLTPKTCDMYMKLCSTNKSVDDIFERANISDDYYSYNFFLALYDRELTVYDGVTFDISASSESKDFLDSLVGKRITKFDPEKPMIKFRYNISTYVDENGNEFDDESGAVFFEVQDMEMFKQLCRETTIEEYGISK